MFAPSKPDCKQRLLGECTFRTWEWKVISIGWRSYIRGHQSASPSLFPFSLVAKLNWGLVRIETNSFSVFNNFRVHWHVALWHRFCPGGTPIWEGRGCSSGIFVLTPKRYQKGRGSRFIRPQKVPKPAAYGIRNAGFVMPASFCRDISLHWHWSP